MVQADGDAERDAALLLVHSRWKSQPRRHRTVAADKAYDTGDFVETVGAIQSLPMFREI